MAIPFPSRPSLSASSLPPTRTRSVLPFVHPVLPPGCLFACVFRLGLAPNARQGDTQASSLGRTRLEGTGGPERMRLGARGPVVSRTLPRGMVQKLDPSKKKVEAFKKKVGPPQHYDFKSIFHQDFVGVMVCVFECMYCSESSSKVFGKKRNHQVRKGNYSLLIYTHTDQEKEIVSLASYLSPLHQKHTIAGK